MSAIRIEIPQAFSGLFQPKRYKIYYGGRGGAKSHNFARALLVRGMQHPLRILCARELQNSIGDSVHKLLSDLIAQHNLSAFYEVQKAVIKGANGTEFIFKGLKYNANEIKSTEGIDIAWIEEAEKVSDASWEMLIPTVRKHNSEIWISFNTKNITDPTYQRFVVNATPDMQVRKVSWRDNPFFPEVLDIERKRLEVQDPIAYAHIWEGEPDLRRSGTIYAQLIDQARTAGRITGVPNKPNVPTITAWDLGKRHGTCIWFAQVVGREVRVVDYHEAYGSDAEIDKLAAVVLGKEYLYEAHYTPHDGKHERLGMKGSINDQLRKAGLHIKEVSSLSIQAGIEKGKALLKEAYIDQTRCKNGLHAMQHYHYEFDEARQCFKNDPYDDWSADACFVGETMLLTRSGMQRIMDMPQTGEVYTLCGWKHYNNLAVTQRNAQLVEVAFEDGTTVKCTPEHLFLTARGWKSANALVTGLEILSSLTNSRSISTATFTVMCIRSVIALREAKACIEKFGALLSERFRQIAISTIRMETLETTALITLNVCQPKSIYPRLGLRMKNHTGAGDLAQKQEKRQQIGTNHQKADCGTAGKPSVPKAGLNGNESQGIVQYAKRNFHALLGIMAIRKSSVAQTAKPLTIAGIRSIDERADVYCMSVPNVRHFSLANGAIVHNCDAWRYLAIALDQRPSGMAPTHTSRKVLTSTSNIQRNKVKLGRTS